MDNPDPNGSKVVPRPLRVMTYNIHRAIGVDRRFRPQRIVSVIEHHDPDIVLLQEVDDDARRSGRFDLGREMAEALEYPHHSVGHNVSLRWRPGRYGNAILSRFELEDCINFDLTIGRRKGRGCQIARIPIEGADEPLHVLNLHLGLSARERRMQVDRLLESDEFQSIPVGAPVILGGDFNDWRGRLPELMKEGGFERLTPNGSGPDALLTYPSFSPRGALDALYRRGPLECHDVARSELKVCRVASDHLPLIGDLAVSGD